MTQGLQARNDWGLDTRNSLHYTPHQGEVRGTHVANRETLWTEEERERRGRNTWRNCVSGWVNDWKIVVWYQQSLLMLYFPSQGTYCPMFLWLAFCEMGLKREAVKRQIVLISCYFLTILFTTIKSATPWKAFLSPSLKHPTPSLTHTICLLFSSLLYLVLTRLALWLSFISKD